MKRNDNNKQQRFMQTQFHITRDNSQDNEEKVIKGYFALYENETQLGDNCFEIITKGAFKDTIIKNDIRALINHDTTLVLGRNKSGTLKLKEDEKGLYGEIKINENDTDAMNLYSRVQRGDVDQCSIGFNIVDEDPEELADGCFRFRINEIDLHEVSCCTFPAYEDTSIQARKRDIENFQSRKFESKKINLRKKLEEIKNA